ncbi:expressed unknown protein [Ectocarpus siliculosus]|uniref:Uncharacterized protein n=1 Tax=Ectocarpus siliculosus TaxID=2880 RepID=D7G4G2_ECTSI|nr:expressed unknown protein [Ectocarpus siliculosus]|eukprot:CBJ33708.1 expressed unknown protein [Ectocarpus siliculosus]
MCSKRGLRGIQSSRAARTGFNSVALGMPDDITRR